ASPLGSSASATSLSTRPVSIISTAPGYSAGRLAGNCTTCWKVGRLTHGIEGTCPTPTALYWMSSRAGLHLAPSPWPAPGSRPPVSLLREHVHALGSLLP